MNEPIFAKEYAAITAMAGGMSGTQRQILSYLVQHMGYDNEVMVTTDERDKFLHLADISLSHFRASLGALRRQDVIQRLHRREYMINPEFYAKAKWKVVMNLKATYLRHSVENRGDVDESAEDIADQIDSGEYDTAEKLFDYMFWPIYPIKKGKKAALKAFKKLKPDVVLVDEMIEAIGLQLQEHELRIERREFVPEWKHPATWLNGECWNDAVNLTETRNEETGRGASKISTVEQANEKADQFIEQYRANRQVQTGSDDS